MMEIVTQSMTVLYTAKTHTVGGRENGNARSSDGHLDIKLSRPGEGDIGTNPEQLFAAGWSACFEGAMDIAARRRRIMLPEDIAVDAEIDLCYDGREYFLQARLNISIPGVDRELAQEVIDVARRVCHYSRATEGNVNVEYNLV